jgi:protein tyrosine/serine phosphatase
LYRGGQPEELDLEHLRELGVSTIIDLRREDIGTRRSERASAEALGLQFLDFPFYGVFGAEQEFLEKILVQMARTGEGGVYVHCKNGRDRTSLLVALYRVAYQGWDIDRAWEEEVMAYDHTPTRFYRKIGSVYRELASEYAAQPGTPADVAVTAP